MRNLRVVWFALVGLSSSVACAGVDKDLTNEELLKMRDPFKRIVLPKRSEEPKSDLENFTVDQFKLLGVIKGLNRPRAMLGGPNGRTYFVTDGAKIGTHRGVVIRIDPSVIHIREKFVNLLGKDENIDTQLVLNEVGKTSAKLGTGW